MLSRHRDKAIATLKAGLKAVPDDATGLATLIEFLTEPAKTAASPPRPSSPRPRRSPSRSASATRRGT